MLINEYREAIKAIEGAAKSAELFNDIGSKTNKTLGEMQRELLALRNTTFDGLKEAEANCVIKIAEKERHLENL